VPDLRARRPMPISDPYARFQQAERMKREGMIENNRIYLTRAKRSTKAIRSRSSSAARRSPWRHC